MTIPLIDRRDVHKLLGGGIVILFGLNSSAPSAAAERPAYPTDFNAYLKIGDTGRVTVFSGKIEMGQGVMTSLAQMAAEELGADLSSIDMVLGDTETCPWDMGTFGSMSTRVFGPALRAAAAKARVVLTSIAAKTLGVSADKLSIEASTVSVIGDASRQISFADLSKRVKTAQAIDEAATLHSAANFTVIGSSPKRLDGVEKVTGAAKYAADMRLPNMLYARILRPPMHGASLTQVDTAAAEQLPGVRVVKRGDLIAVLHAEPDAAVAALAQIHADWKLPDATLNPNTIFDHILADAGDQKTVSSKGSLATASSVQPFETIFHKGYVAHAPMEPHAALADVRATSATIWASTQTPFPTRDRIAKALGFDPKSVRVITPFVGGGFGGKSAGGQALEAASLSQLVSKPVLVEWTRAEEFFLDTFDPASVVKIRSALDKDGNITSWDYSVFAAGERGANTFYNIPNVRILSAGGTSYSGASGTAGLHPFAVGPWRGPGANMNVFATESQIDIMAKAAGADPLAFRLRHIQDPRMRSVLLAAAKAFGWQEAIGPSGRGYGIACSSDAGSCVATMAEVKVDKSTGKVTVLRMVCAQDMGVIVNPIGATMQIEGGLTMGQGYALTEELRFQGGEILDQNFDTYYLPRFSSTPHIQVVLVKNDDIAPQGCGEPAITTTGAVIANAVFDASGARMTRLPMTANRILAAILSLPVQSGLPKASK